MAEGEGVTAAPSIGQSMPPPPPGFTPRRVPGRLTPCRLSPWVSEDMPPAPYSTEAILADSMTGFHYPALTQAPSGEAGGQRHAPPPTLGSETSAVEVGSGAGGVTGAEDTSMEEPHAEDSPDRRRSYHVEDSPDMLSLAGSPLVPVRSGLLGDYLHRRARVTVPRATRDRAAPGRGEGRRGDTQGHECY